MVMEASILVQKATFKGSGCAILVGKLQFLGLLGYVGKSNGWGSYRVLLKGIGIDVFGSLFLDSTRSRHCFVIREKRRKGIYYVYG